jgi:segregation and condensation protein A
MFKLILPNFEGPFDLLLYFIKRDELNIYDIPISRITEEFLKYVRLIEMFDLDLAGDFLVMAASLMMIKAQMLLPRTQGDEDGDAEDPRTELVNKLLEYKQMKEAAREMNFTIDEQKYILYRNVFDEDRKIANNAVDVNYYKSTVYDLIKALRRAVDRSHIPASPHVVEKYSVTVEERSEWLMTTLLTKKRISFMQILREEARPIVVVTFLSILELIKKGRIFVLQSELFDDIIITEAPEINLN